MKAVILTVAVGLASVLVTPKAFAGPNCPAESRYPALLTIPALHMHNQPIRTKTADLAKGPIWDCGFATRPGDGLTMVIDAHDVTPVPGYGPHGPFYRLYTIKPGNLARIKWNGVWRTYRFITHPFAKRQCLSKRLNEDVRRLNGEISCVVNNRPVRSWPAEGFYIRCCWPRHTRHDFLYERAVLVQPRQ